MSWTQFWDLNSGGGWKEKWGQIFIEAPEDEARVIFYNRFGHNPDRISCTCCGQDYSVSEHERLEDATAFHRNCEWYCSDEEGRYFEKGEVIPEGWTRTRNFTEPFENWISLDTYIASGEAHFIRADKIKDDERVGEVPKEGYVWL